MIPSDAHHSEADHSMTLASKISENAIQGPSIKYVTLEGVREGVTVCDRGEGVKSM